MISVDPYLNRVRTPKYNCWDFVREVWFDLTGEDVTERMSTLIGDFKSRHVNLSGVRGSRLKEPVDPCIVVMQRMKFVPHVGIYLRGRILHLMCSGVEFQLPDVAKRYYQRVSYYR